MAMKKGGLGKGLSAIFMENESEDKNSTVTLKIADIEPNRSQPRQDFDEAALADLANSISQHGLLQPLLVRPLIGGGYQLVAGERRWRACRMAGVNEVPVVIRELTDAETMELALIENLQREDLSPIEEALGYKTLMDTYGFTQEDVSRSVGKSRPAVANVLRLLNLPDEVIAMVRSGELSAGHARTLLALKDESKILELARLAVDNDASVRELERAVKKYNKAAEGQSEEAEAPKLPKRNSFFDEVELALNEHLARKVKVCGGEKDKGILQIEFYSADDLKELAQLLGKE